jgi:hypothetical protein
MMTTRKRLPFLQEFISFPVEEDAAQKSHPLVDYKVRQR